MKELSEDIQKAIDDLPESLVPVITLRHPNEPVSIFKGPIDLRIREKQYLIEGDIYFTWTPETGIKVKGTPDQFIFPENIDKLEFGGFNIQHGSSFVTSVGADGLTAHINSPFIISTNISCITGVHFELPNFRDYIGSAVKVGRRMTTSRLFFENEDWSVTIDKVADFERLKKELHVNGGFALLHTGELNFKKGSFDIQHIPPIVRKLGLFISFLNGRRSYPCFLSSLDDDESLWKDYSASYADRYKSVSTWLPQADFSDLSKLWGNYINLANDANSLECIDYLLHWYFEANNNSGFSEGSIVLLQNAFELLFNWQMVEVRNLYTPAHAKDKSAADKIRALLRDASIPLGLPPKYKKLEAHLKADKIHFKDFPELFTLIRNAITHANYHKRLNLAKVPSISRHHIKDIGICYLELLLLKLFGYNGKYASRISENMFVGGNEENVPWNT